MALSELSWPSSLPQKPSGIANEFKLLIGRNILRSEFDSGNSRQRKRTSSMLDTRSVSYKALTKEQVDTLYDFVQTVGGRFFWWPDPENEGNQLYARIVGTSDVEITNTTTLLYSTSLQLEVDKYVTSD